MCDKFKKSRGEARTCNVCSSTSLSSCMHIKPVASLSQAATETDGFSDEISMGKAAPTSQDFESNSKVRLLRNQLFMVVISLREEEIECPVVIFTKIIFTGISVSFKQSKFVRNFIFD